MEDLKNTKVVNSNIVPTNIAYNYQILMQNIQSLKKAYPFLEVGIIGKSVLEKDLPYIRIGTGKHEVMYHAGIHANEWICCILLMKFVENFCKAYVKNEVIYDKSAQELFNTTSLYILPMMNPDGIDLVTKTLNKDSKEYKHYMEISNSFPDIPFPDGWKANFNGVDLKNYQPVC